MSFCAQCKQSILRPTRGINSAELDQKLRSSYGSSADEVAEVSQLVQLADKNLMAYSEEIRRLQGRIAYLESQRERLSDRKMKLCSLRAPIRRLPPDVLMDIFEKCCTQNEFSDPDVLPPAMILASVCSGWREVAVEFPRMWSSLAVDPDTGSEEYYTRLRVALKMYLLRSKEHPLDLTFKVQSFHNSLSANKIPLLIQEYHRWRNVTLAHHPPLLELRLPLQERVLPGTGSLLDLDVASNVRHATNLSCLPTYLDNFSPRVCVHVKHLSLRPSFGFGYGATSTNRGFEAPSIRTLSVRWLDDLDVCSLPMPTLDELNVDLVPDLCGHGSGKRPFTAISTFLARSKCLLTSLSLENVSLTDAEAITVLAPLKNLTRLLISDPKASGDPAIARPLTKPFVESLHEYRRTSLHSAAQPMLPKLRYLTLKPSSTNSNTGLVDAFVETVRSRWCPLDASEDLAVDCLWSVELHLAADVDATAHNNQLFFERPAMRVVVKGPRGYLM